MVTAYWLIPAEPARGYFQDVINDLAKRYAAPEFEPHVTVHVGVNCSNKVTEAVLISARRSKPIALRVLNVSNSGEFIKTLFVTFDRSFQLQRLNQSIRKAAQDSSSTYQLNPHLSLLYKNMSTADRNRLARRIEVPFTEVTFDSLKAVRCISPTKSRADVEAWRFTAETPLSG
ncbi:MAG TPA: hypothetical protein VFA51_02930 [Candidatus Udaeobacter sp.]|nr:hypothetical protein [Candidatus Udaeobacter sp.]